MPTEHSELLAPSAIAAQAVPWLTLSDEFTAAPTHEPTVVNLEDRSGCLSKVRMKRVSFARLGVR